MIIVITSNYSKESLHIGIIDKIVIEENGIERVEKIEN